MPSCWQPSASPRTASANCHITAGSSGRAEVQAVGDRQRPGAGGRDVAVRLGQRQLGAGVRIEPAVPAVAVHRHRDADVAVRAVRAGQPHDAGVLRLGQHRVALHVPVVLVGDPGLVGQVRPSEISFSAVLRNCSPDFGRGRPLPCSPLSASWSYGRRTGRR